MSGSFLVCRGLEKRFGDVIAVRDLNLEVSRGEVLALLGPSGCGKTTLLRLIAGFETPDRGEIELDGRLLVGPGASVPPERRRIPVVFQDFALFPHMTVAANIAFGLPKGSPKGRTQELLRLVNLEGLESRMPHQLSGGQQQRVALARALAADPQLILLDEPFSNLDPAIRERVRIEVRDLLEKAGVTAIIVTHDQEEALSLARRVAVMMHGTIVQAGAPADVYRSPATREVAEFIGHANFFPARVQASMAVSELGDVPVESTLSGEVELMVRAEDLYLTEEGVPAEVVNSEYYGHDQLATIRTQGGSLLRVRLPATNTLSPGQRVGVSIRGEVEVFPVKASPADA